MPNSRLTRRSFGGALAGTMALAILPRAAAALDDASARALIDRAVGEVHEIINSGRSEARMLTDFEGIFTRYADVTTIARTTLGAAARQATAAQMSAYTRAFGIYLSHKYGRRFREFIGARIEITGSRPLKSFYEVRSVAYLQGEAPFELLWYVSSASGRDLFFNIVIEGVDLLNSERIEMGAMLDRRRGDLDAMIADLRARG
ncbi:MlaC/ttg2D family ABC transporter substrate-binding protein [Phaeovulum sp.]|uniref:MlaC/ttg2D family ABC transporter substrate-binding protein n=1 Tax=Phaeovulum sp. TaxID=2934796 RepID=UPI00272FEC4A|nr:ABC transporter substrate-binding protein [Phaeovulum sp.]MDP1669321.1 ABC transporter substrate-binding protein [Phaeovulum sp.]MDZ4119597.1 ABC transporter substrate-binding protein [Phaeovulum sp.]